MRLVQPRPDPLVGLCATCRHVRLVTNRRGSSFYNCSRSAADPRFPRYPRLPVLKCVGWEEALEGAALGERVDPDQARPPGGAPSR